jgi:hypothetical protein
LKRRPSVLSGPVARRERVVDDGNRLRSGAIVGAQKAAAQQIRFHAAKYPGVVH